MFNAFKRSFLVLVILTCLGLTIACTPGGKSVSVVSYSKEPPSKGSLVIVLDTSGSMDTVVNPTAGISRSKIDIVRELLLNEYLPFVKDDFALGLEVFYGGPFCVPLKNINTRLETSDHKKYTQLEYVMEQCQNVGSAGGTPLLTTLDTAAKSIETYEKRTGNKGQRVIVMVTDGEDSTNRSDYDSVIKKLTAENFEIYAIAIRASEGEGQGLKNALKPLGDHYVDAVGSEAALEKAFEKVFKAIEQKN